MSELSRASGVPIPTIKFYVREGLLPPGVPTARTQAEYSEAHVRRLRLIRTLTEVGGVRLRDVGTVLRAIDDERVGIHELLGEAHHALDPLPDASLTSDEAQALADVDAFLGRLGWRVSGDAPARRRLARALLTLRSLGGDVGVEVFEPYARIAEKLAAREVSTVPTRTSRAETVEAVVIGTVVFEAALVALRRLAQEHRSSLRFARRKPEERSSRPGTPSSRNRRSHL